MAPAHENATRWWLPAERPEPGACVRGVCPQLVPKQGSKRFQLGSLGDLGGF
jgi:hypothetical protein